MNEIMLPPPPLLRLINHQSLTCNFVSQIETSDPKELNEEFLHDQLHPRKDLIRQKFAKPPKPSGSRGPRRIHKETSSTE